MKKTNYMKFFLLVIVFGFIVKALLDILPLEKSGITGIEWIVFIAVILLTIPFVYTYMKKREKAGRE